MLLAETGQQPRVLVDCFSYPWHVICSRRNIPFLLSWGILFLSCSGHRVPLSALMFYHRSHTFCIPGGCTSAAGPYRNIYFHRTDKARFRLEQDRRRYNLIRSEILLRFDIQGRWSFSEAAGLSRQDAVSDLTTNRQTPIYNLIEGLMQWGGRSNSNMFVRLNGKILFDKNLL